MGRLLLSAITLVTGLLFARVAIAAPAEATRLFEEGRELAKQGRHAEACDRFTQSLALEPAPGTKRVTVTPAATPTSVGFALSARF